MKNAKKPVHIRFYSKKTARDDKKINT